ncbi:hypothetical protein EYC80_004862 [Monilinia laxa]|uniref:Uncharacterized protein n=1 Tax=Monilinia laxa TaxID=61186 RepID=A0A5N6KIC6_MONLA|nr:hypothetical protein EYC80_004862 [Monilinia laxa]
MIGKKAGIWQVVGWGSGWFGLIWSAWDGFQIFFAMGKGSGYSFMIPPIIRRCDFDTYVGIQDIQSWEVHV